MHGSSSVPQDLLAQIREYGGSMKETYGVPVSEIQEAIKHGVRKINIDTDIRLAMTGAIRKFFATNPEKFDPRDYLKPAREAAKAICKQRYQQFGCEGQAAKIKAESLSVIATRYAKGELAQRDCVIVAMSQEGALCAPFLDAGSLKDSPCHSGSLQWLRVRTRWGERRQAPLEHDIG